MAFTAMPMRGGYKQCSASVVTNGMKKKQLSELLLVLFVAFKQVFGEFYDADVHRAVVFR